MNNKRLLLIVTFFSVITLYIMHSVSRRQKKEPTLVTLVSTNPKEIIFLWDLHEVVFEKNILNWLKIGWYHDRKLQTIFKLSPKIIKIAFTYLFEKIKLIDTQATSEELIVAAKKAGNQGLIDLTINIGCSYQPIAKTVEIINELKQLGYRHHIGSNIGNTVFQAFKKKFPEIFSTFSQAHIVHYVKSEPVIKKPSAQYFTTYLETNNIQPSQVIFIDDRYPNIKAARSLGITSIHFKNSDQLRNDLQKLGFGLERQAQIV